MIDWNKISDEYATAHLEPIGEEIRPHHAITPDDLDDIFAGRPLSEHPRQKANIMRKTYLTPDMAQLADKKAKEEHISRAALLRKALAAYLNQNMPSSSAVSA